MRNIMSKQELLDSVKISLLQAGGVDNWTWYSESIEQFENDNYEIEDDADLLCALENGGVDNWEWYSESLGHYPEWEDHVNEFYETDNYLDYEDFGIELERREKEERAERLAKKKAEEEAKPKSEIAQLKYDHLILAEKIAEFTDGERVEYFYKKVVESEGFWSGLGTDEGRSIFNEAKSENKWTEAALVKIPTIASDVGAFKSQIVDGKTGLLCKTKKDWDEKLEKLILSKELRESIGLQAYNEAMENHVTIKTGTGLRDFIMHKLNKNISFVLPSTNATFSPALIKSPSFFNFVNFTSPSSSSNTLPAKSTPARTPSFLKLNTPFEISLSEKSASVVISPIAPISSLIASLIKSST